MNIGQMTEVMPAAVSRVNKTVAEVESNVAAGTAICEIDWPKRLGRLVALCIVLIGAIVIGVTAGCMSGQPHQNLALISISVN